MTQHHRGNEQTEIPLGAEIAEQPAGTAKKNKISGRTILNITLALVVIAAVAIGAASAAGVKFSDNKNENESAVQNALEANDGDINDDRSAPTNNPIPQIALGRECLSEDAFDVRGDGTLLMRGGINAEENTVTVEIEYVGEAWLGFAFSESEAMVPNTAIIGLPKDKKVEKYSLEGKILDRVNPLNQRQTLSATSITQNDGITTLQFTKPLVEENEVSISGVGEIRFNWAIGSGNDLGVHAARGSTVAPFAACLLNDIVGDEKDAVVDTQAPTSAPTTSLATEIPTASPTAGLVTDAPTTASPTASPTSSRVTNVPTGTPTGAPSAAVTPAPWTAPPKASHPYGAGGYY